MDAVRFPRLAKEILAGNIARTSMGCDVKYSVCSACNNRATTPAEHCSHIPAPKGMMLYRRTASGHKVGEIIRETCYGLKFFENSLLVEPPADPTAHFLGVDTRGLSMAAMKKGAPFAGYEDFDECTSENSDKDDPSAYCGEIKHRTEDKKVARVLTDLFRVEGAQQYPNPGDHPWFAETGIHHKNIVDHWEDATDEEKAQGKRWYPDAHLVAKQIAKLHPGITDEKEAAHKGAGVLSAYSPQQNWWANQHNAARSFHEQRALGKGEGLFIMGSHQRAAQRIMDGEDSQRVLKGPKTADFAHLIEHGGYKPQSDEDAAAGKPKEHSDKVVVDRHALSVAAGRRLNADDVKGFPSQNRHYYEHVAGEYRKAAAVISDREGREVPPHEVQAVTWLTRQRKNKDEEISTPSGKGRQTMQQNQRKQWQDLSRQHTPGLHEDPVNSHVAPDPEPAQPRQASRGVVPPFGGEPVTALHRTASLKTQAYGEQKAPMDVDTLREDACPVCGDRDTFDGAQCQVCSYVAPPKMFQDPDLGVARQMDLRKDIADFQDQDNPNQVGPDGQPLDQSALGPDGQPLDPAADPSMQPGGLPGEVQAEVQPGGDPMDPAQMGEDGQIPDESGIPVDPAMVAPDGTPLAPAGQPMVGPDGLPIGPQELPAGATTNMGQPFTPGPNMPQGPGDPEGPEGPLSPEELAENGQPEDEEDGAPPNPMAGQGAPGTPGDGVPDLMCPGCGFTADATQPTSVDMDTQTLPNTGVAMQDGVQAGDICPNCGQAQLLSPAEVQGETPVPMPV